MSQIVHAVLKSFGVKIAATEGHKMSKPPTNVLYIDHLKVNAQSESKLSCVLNNTSSCMNDIALQLKLNPRSAM